MFTKFFSVYHRCSPKSFLCIINVHQNFFVFTNVHQLLSPTGTLPNTPQWFWSFWRSPPGTTFGWRGLWRRRGPSCWTRFASDTSYFCPWFQSFLTKNPVLRRFEAAFKAEGFDTKETFVFMSVDDMARMGIPPGVRRLLENAKNEFATSSNQMWVFFFSLTRANHTLIVTPDQVTP